MTAKDVQRALESHPLPASSGEGAPGDRYRFANRYWVFVQRGEQLEPVNVETGLTDLDYSEVIRGLALGDTVVLLPSSGLVQSQRRLQEAMRRFTGMPGMSDGKRNGGNRGDAEAAEGRPARRD